MFDELSAADEALALGTSEPPAGAVTLASRTTARHARDKDDLLVLLDALGLPTDPDATTPLLPLIPTPDPAADAVDPELSGDQPVMPHSPAQSADDVPAVDAFEAVAVSMHHSGYPTAAITEATGLTEEEITAVVAVADGTDPATTEPAPAAAAPESEITPGTVTAEDTAADDTATSVPDHTVPDIVDTNVLLPWAEQHPLASVRAKAARIRQDLADLTQRLATEQATAEAEARIVQLRADLKAEEERLRQLKAGGPRAAAVIEAPTPIRPASGKRSREELAAIRTWARENGHQVGAAGVIKASIMEAYDAAHQPATLAKAG
ncbi:Lsr2 family DNA-binding protein [Actinacidiphila paucisporea]|uniref:Lsr2 protein n=1 Tax=Actinacidiphila paucisporea TaxID=310782 RepID=A0A1M7QSA1_9ACTN|nr:histone-like nucleoid-structuring protein Lsr2 [Actinacidiphila paucisporea]SHN34477.1 Lsr2 protein [Actinacidiphila paucisporea]